MIDLDTFVARRKTAQPTTLKSSNERVPRLVTEPLEKMLLQQAAQASWIKSDSPKHIASHIDNVKFGRDNYGYGLGKIEVKSVDPSLRNSFLKTRQTLPTIKTVDPLNLTSF